MKKRKLLTTKEGEVRELTRKDIRRMRPMEEILSSHLVNVIKKRKRGERGPQKEPTKVAVTVRYNTEVIEYFKKTGTGWQTRMNDVLMAHIKKKKHKDAA